MSWKKCKKLLGQGVTLMPPGGPKLADSKINTVKAWIDRAQTRWTPSNRDRWYGLGANTWAGGGRWAVSHGGMFIVKAGPGSGAWAPAA